VTDILILLAISFTNTQIVKEFDRPFPNSKTASELSWNQMISNGICLLTENRSIIVPFHLVNQIIELPTMKLNELNDYEIVLVRCLQQLERNIGVSKINIPQWLTWESFGAQFYAIRINSFLVLGLFDVKLSELLSGAGVFSDIFDCMVTLKFAKVIQSSVPFGPDMPTMIKSKDCYVPQKWFGNDEISVILNCDNGDGVDIIIVLQCSKTEDGFIVLLDQRKRLAADITQSGLSSYLDKVPCIPKCLSASGKTQTVFGPASIYSDIRVKPLFPFYPRVLHQH
jgi:hypothetical protein